MLTEHTLRFGLAPWTRLHTVIRFSLQRENHTPKRPPPLIMKEDPNTQKILFLRLSAEVVKGVVGERGGGADLRLLLSLLRPAGKQRPDVQIRKRRKKRWIL